MQSDRFKQLRATVRGNRGDAHFGHDLVQAFIDAVTIVQHHGTVIFLDSFAINQFGQGFIGQVRIDGSGAEAQQHRKVVWVAGAGGFNNDVGIAAQALIHEASLNRSDRHRCRYRQTIFSNRTVREHQQYGTVTDHLLGFIAQRFDGLFQRGLGHVEGNVQHICLIVLFFHRGELGEIRVQQNRRFEAQTVRLAFRFAEDVHLTADAGSQRHHVRFTQRVDRRVSHLRELLTEVVIDDTWLAGEYGKWGIVTH